MCDSKTNFYFHFAVVTLGLLLTACATPEDARSKGPVAVYKSTNSSKAVAACIATRWESDYGVTNPVFVRPTEDGFTLQISANGNTMLVLDVKDAGTGSETSYFKGRVWMEGRWDQSVLACQ